MQALKYHQLEFGLRLWRTALELEKFRSAPS